MDAPTNRRHDIDALRALAFLLVILYHVGMYYVPGWHWHLKSPEPAGWLVVPMRALNLWRLDLLFLVSGIAMSFLARSRAGGTLLAERSQRLLLPLAFGMAVVVPYQPYAQALANGVVEPGFADFLRRYFTLGPWPRDAFDGAQPGITWNHLWYLAYLWAYTAAWLLLRPLAARAGGGRIAQAFRALRGVQLVLLPVLPLAAWGLLLRPHFPPTHDLLHDAWLHAVYFTLFLYGTWLGADEGLWAEVRRLRWRSLAGAAALLVLGPVLLPSLGAPAPVLRLLGDLYAWFAILAVCGWAYALLNRPWPWLAWAHEQVYPWYVLHQTVLIVLIVQLAPLHLPTGLEAALLVAGTIAGCWSLTAVIRRSRWLRPLFGLKPRARPRCPSTGSPARPAAHSA